MLSHLSGHFSPISRARPHSFGCFCAHFGLEAPNGSVPGPQRGLQVHPETAPPNSLSLSLCCALRSTEQSTFFQQTFRYLSRFWSLLSRGFSWPSWAFFMAFSWFFRDFSVAFRGPHFGQILRVLALEKSSDFCQGDSSWERKGGEKLPREEEEEGWPAKGAKRKKGCVTTGLVAPCS